MEKTEIVTIAHIRSPYGSKFGIPRQSNLVGGTPATIVFEPEYRDPEALRGIGTFDYLWLVWLFSENKEKGWHATVRPPRLGGNKRMGVFATRSPFRPNALGLSSVRLIGVTEQSEEGPLLHVDGADLMDGTPIVDIKPYIAYCDAHAEARSGFAATAPERLATVDWAAGTQEALSPELRSALEEVLRQDPRPQYQRDETRVYGMTFDRYEVKFRIADGRVTVVAIASNDGARQQHKF